MFQAHQDPYYEQLRARARQAGDSMSNSFEEAKLAFQRGEKAKAKQLAEAGKRYQADMHRLNEEASQWVHEQLNSGDKDGLDLHGRSIEAPCSGVLSVAFRVIRQGSGQAGRVGHTSCAE
ncbi:Smr domain protein, putative [Rhizoctonia solani AG-3 Rhs1AP]|uniref:Smr domain protein, putative n=1 Tax=Rhizoctonia solani AG-3 Rhs1AP TaxID=1086054 RepID=A0A0A1UJE0_9AGAM|nr:Smr domain protein, putative [Rhizoctonia solani AG-3 Rhs1AP]